MKLQHGDNSTIKNQIKEAATVLFRSQGYENTTVIQLVQKIQIEEQIFYSYFQSLDELLEVVWSES